MRRRCNSNASRSPTVSACTISGVIVSSAPSRKMQRASSAVTRPGAVSSSPASSRNASSSPLSGRKFASRKQVPSLHQPPGIRTPYWSFRFIALGSTGSGSLCRDGEAGFLRFRDRYVALPTFVFELNVLNRYRSGVGIQIRHSLILGNPAAINLVRDYFLSGFVKQIQNHVFAEVRQRHLRTQP